MFCPKCGAEIVLNRGRFCAICHFPFSSLNEFIETEVAKYQNKHYPLRQRDITLGAGLMTIGALQAWMLGLAMGDSGSENEGFIVAIGLLFSAMLMFSQLSPRQRGLTLGATLVFTGSLLTYATGGLSALLIPMIFLPIILQWSRITRAFMRIFFDKEIISENNINSPTPGVQSD